MKINKNKINFIARGFGFFLIFSMYIILTKNGIKAGPPVLTPLMSCMFIAAISGFLAWAFFGFLVEIKRVITHTEEIDSVKEQ